MHWKQREIAERREVKFFHGQNNPTTGWLLLVLFSFYSSVIITRARIYSHADLQAYLEVCITISPLKFLSIFVFSIHEHDNDNPCVAGTNRGFLGTSRNSAWSGIFGLHLFSPSHRGHGRVRGYRVHKLFGSPGEYIHHCQRFGKSTKRMRGT